MKLIKPSFEILTEFDGVAMLKRIEKYARVCYKSEDLITDDSYIKFLTNIVLTNHHESIIEHEHIAVKFTIDRGVLLELTRHRLASFTVSSTRYCNYSKDKFGNEITLIDPSNHFKTQEAHLVWDNLVEASQEAYMKLLEIGESPQMARSILPNSLMTEVVMTANLREWRHVLELRTAKNAHPQMSEVMIPLLKKFQNRIPLLFDHIKPEH